MLDFLDLLALAFDQYTLDVSRREDLVVVLNEAVAVQHVEDEHRQQGDRVSREAHPEHRHEQQQQRAHHARRDGDQVPHDPKRVDRDRILVDPLGEHGPQREDHDHEPQLPRADEHIPVECKQIRESQKAS